MLKVLVTKNNNYRIRIDSNILENVGDLLNTVTESNQIFIISDENVANQYLEKLEMILYNSNYEISKFIINGGEKNKSITTAFKIINAMINMGIHRKASILAFGGGVVTDLSGFIASIYMRGINYINIPTTLLSQVDASIGGKTAVNLPNCKNLIGSFYHPRLVVIDPSLLASLSINEIRHGLAEIIKISIICSENLFSNIESNLGKILNKDIDILSDIVLKGIKLKIGLLKSDPYEVDLHRKLNFGHIIGHSIEVTENYARYSHGEAISIGMMAETRYAYEKKICTKDTKDRIENLLLISGLPTHYQLENKEALIQSINKMKMIRGNSFNIVLPTKIGDCIIQNDVLIEDLCKLL